MSATSLFSADRPLDDALLAVAAQRAAAVATLHDDPTRAIDSAVEALHDAIPGTLPSVFVLEHGRLWLVAQRGYPFVPDGIEIERGVMGRAVRLAAPQLSTDVSSDSDYLGALPAVTSEVAVPLRAGRAIVGVLNLESERSLPPAAVQLLAPLASVLAPAAERLRVGRRLDLPALARLFVYLGSLREPSEIATLGAVSLSRVLDIERSEVWTWDDVGTPSALAAWSADESDRPPLVQSELEAARLLVDPSAICQLVDVGGQVGASQGRLVWLPLRANGEELGVLVAVTNSRDSVDADVLDTAAVLAAHVAASLDAALALRRERRSALTDPLTGILNRRGLEALLDEELPRAQARRLPLSILVLDGDDFKEINDRAGHEFGDTLLREVADVLSASIPATSAVARLGGDEFLVVLPGAGADAAEGLATEIRGVLADGLTEAGYPLRMSAGIATYPFDGAGPTALLRAADQALYAAKDLGKDRIASFRDVAHPRVRTVGTSSEGSERRQVARGDGSVLAEAIAAAAAIEAEESSDGVCTRLAKALVFTIGATACTVSRVKGDLLVDTSGHALREVSLGDEAAYRIADFPLTAETLGSGEPRTVSFVDDDVDPAEAFILRELGMNAVLMIPLEVAGQSWGLVELYEMRLRRFTHDDIGVAQFLSNRAERRLELVSPTEPRQRRVYELPPGTGRTGPPRTR